MRCTGSVTATKAALLTAAFLFLPLATPVGQAEAKLQCFTGGQVYGKIASGVSKSKAKERARRKWGDAAEKYMGTSRARNWGNAKFQGHSCDKKGIWYCRAIATPCV
jgi:hypothetical protein